MNEQNLEQVSEAQKALLELSRSLRELRDSLTEAALTLRDISYDEDYALRQGIAEQCKKVMIDLKLKL